MVKRPFPIRTAWRWLAGTLGLAAYLAALGFFAGGPVSAPRVAAGWAWSAALLLAALTTRPRLAAGRGHAWPGPGVLLLLTAAAAGLIYAVGGATWAAWLALGGIYLLLLHLDAALGAGRPLWLRAALRLALLLIAGLAPVAIGEVEAHFADEEFFVALQALALGAFWLLLAVVRDLIAGSSAHVNIARVSAVPGAGAPGDGQGVHQGGLRLDGRWLAAAIAVATVAGLAGTVRAYQGSFYPASAPPYPGITPQTPFICGAAAPAAGPAYTGAEVFQRLLAFVAANPAKGSPEYATLALGTAAGPQRQAWAAAFHDRVLAEAAAATFTGPAGSVKSSQYEAAQRAYYLPRMRAAFPDLFTAEELARLQAWFAAINRRALTVEWVDWMYGLAFRQPPAGPYENQENGAGLLASLLAADLAPVNLAPADRAYLAANPRGWNQRFHNTDDAYSYQIEWIDNAYFQSLYTGQASPENVRLAFEWLAAQALPDGKPLRYNHPISVTLASAAYLGARLTHDSTYVWLAGQALAGMSPSSGDYLLARPGTEQVVDLVGQAPTLGSCLLYGDSGLPNQRGPLAPDKVVLRDGWNADAAYLLLNLRFTGWHRYKASNTITLVYHGATLSADELSGKPFAWLPVGRSLFRDKRIPRENLNGLLVDRTGMSRVLYVLTGIGGPWAQDPPAYAQVLDFKTSTTVDTASTRLAGWRGWQQDRQVALYHNDGPIVVFDRAQGPAGSPAALAWHFPAAQAVTPGRLRLDAGSAPPVAVVFVPLEGVTGTQVRQGAAGPAALDYSLLGRSHLSAATVFLAGKWAGAEVTYDPARAMLHIVAVDRQLDVPWPQHP